MLRIISELSSFCLFSFSLLNFLHSNNCRRTSEGRECTNKLFLELEDAIISKVNNHYDPVRCHSHARGTIHLSKATPLHAKFA